MALSLLFIISLSIILVTLLSLSSGGLQSWLCGTCTVCHPCPACDPPLNISPTCDCKENLNNCNSDCITHQNFKDYQTLWNLKHSSSQHNIHAAHMNTNTLKCHSLDWIIGLLFFTIFLLFLIVVLFFAPALLRRCTKWHSTMKLKRWIRLINKFNLVERSALSSVPPSYDQLLKQLHEQKQQLDQLTRDLLTTHKSSLPSSKIF